MKIIEITPCYGILWKDASPFNKSTGLSWTVGGYDKIQIKTDFPEDLDNVDAQKRISNGLQAIVKKYLPSAVLPTWWGVDVDEHLACVYFCLSAMKAMSVETFLELGRAIFKDGTNVIMDAFSGTEAPTESRKHSSMQKKKEALARKFEA